MIPLDLGGLADLLPYGGLLRTFSEQTNVYFFFFEHNMNSYPVIGVLDLLLMTKTLR